MMTYSGVGSRETPTEVLKAMARIAYRLENAGYTLRSGAAGGADAAFESGVQIKKRVFIPWAGFNGSKSPLVGASVEAMKIAESLHPAWDRCSQGAQKLHGRNVHQVLGENLNEPSDFLICWTPKAERVGGTATAIRLAERHGVKVYNLASPKDVSDFREFLFLAERDAPTLYEVARHSYENGVTYDECRHLERVYEDCSMSFAESGADREGGTIEEYEDWWIPQHLDIPDETPYLECMDNVTALDVEGSQESLDKINS